MYALSRWSLFWFGVWQSFFLLRLQAIELQACLRFPTTFPPEEDPFYDAPFGFERTSPGTILKSRDIKHPPGLIYLEHSLQFAQQFLYRTTDSHGDAIATVTTILVPKHASEDPSKVLSYQMIEDSNFIQCAPSYTIQHITAPARSAIAQVELLIIQAALNQGFIVVLPDYEGPNSAFPAGLLEGHAVLDSIRAVLSSGITEPDSRVALWGYSGGSIATGWAAQIKQYYAPELDIQGVALGGTPANFTSLVQTSNGGIAAGLLVASLFGLSEEYPQVMDLMKAEFSHLTMVHLRKVKHQCLISELLTFPFLDFTHLAKSGDQLFEDPRLKSVLQIIDMGRICPDMPIFLYHSISDETVPIAQIDYLYDMWCHQGASVTLRKDFLSEHATEIIEGAPSALLWIRDRLKDRPAHDYCDAATSATNWFDPDLIHILGHKIWRQMLNILDKMHSSKFY